MGLSIARKALVMGMLGGNRSILPLTIDFSTLADGALPPTLTGATWAIASGVAKNTPTLSEEKFADPGLEAWDTQNTLTNWGEYDPAGATINQETAEQRGGSNCARYDIDVANGDCAILQTPANAAVGLWGVLSAYVKCSTTGKTLNLRLENQRLAILSYAMQTTYTQHMLTSPIITTSGFAAQIRRNSAASCSIYVDDTSYKYLTFSELHATVNAGAANLTVKAAWNIVRGTLAGVIANLDSVSSPLNYLLCLHDGADTIYLWQVLNGALTEITKATAAYVADANVELRQSGTTYQLFYNGLQKGTDQTVNQPAINNNTVYGTFSTWGGNSLNRFFLGSSPEVVSVPDGATIADYLKYVSSGDVLSLATAGHYTLNVGETGFASLANGTAARATTIRGNDAIVTGGLSGVSLTNKAFITVQHLNVRDQTNVCANPTGSDDITFEDCTFGSTVNPAFIDVFKARNCDRMTVTRCTCLPSTGTSTVDGFEFWGPCNDITLTDCIAHGYNNGPTTNDGHGFEVYGTSLAEACDNIRFLRCEAYDCRVGFSSEGGPDENSLHTNIVCEDCNPHDNIEYDYSGVQGATIYVSGYVEGQTTNGNVTIL